jgi:hypothetical protein
MKLMTSICMAMALLITPKFSLAAQVAQMKGKKILIKGDDLQVNTGDSVYMVDSTGKKIGLAIINSSANGKIIATITGGKAQVGNSILKKSGGAKKASSANRSGGTSLGFIGSLNSSTMTISLNSSAKVNMAGSSFGAKVIYDYPVMEDIDLRLFSGIDMLSVKGASSTITCNCKLDVTYINTGGMARYFLSQSKMSTWLGAGGSYQAAMSSSSDVLQKVASTFNILFGGGIDYQTGGGSFIPIQFSYAYYAPTTGVTLSQMLIQGGYGFAF